MLNINKIYFPDTLKEVCDILKNQYQVYIVGGSIRDIIMGKIPHDYDIATDATPSQLITLFSDNNFKIIPTGFEYGVVTVLNGDDKYEIATFRSDGNYLDGRRPTSVTFSKTIEDDISRRDFTMNGIAYDYKNNIICDPFNGIEDIKNKIIRCIGNPYDRFTEDALRILRAVRFATYFNFKIEKETLDALDKLFPLVLTNTSVERTKIELEKILLAMEYYENKEVLSYIKIVLTKIFPEMFVAQNITQYSPYHCHTVYEHTIKSICVAPKNVMIKWALLFHDFGKISTKVIVQNNLNDGMIENFPQHSKLSTEMAKHYLDKYKFDNISSSIICYLVAKHDYTIGLGQRYIAHELKKMKFNYDHKDVLDMLFEVKIADVKAQNPKFIQYRLGQLSLKRELLHFITIPYSLSDLNINGDDIKVINPEIKPELIGKTLNRCLDFVIDYPEYNNQLDLIEYVRNNCNDIRFLKIKNNQLEE